MLVKRLQFCSCQCK